MEAFAVSILNLKMAPDVMDYIVSKASYHQIDT